MARLAGPSPLIAAFAGAFAAALTVASAGAQQQDDDTRAVRVIQSPDAPAQGGLSPAPPATEPAAPAALPNLPPAPPPPPLPAAANAAPPAPSSTQDAARPQVALGAIPLDAKTANPADLALDVL